MCDSAVIDGQLSYLRLVQERAKEGFAAGDEPLEVARRTDLGEFAGWTDPERLVGNLHRAYRERDGAPAGSPIALTDAVGDMVTMYGGPIRCLA